MAKAAEPPTFDALVRRPGLIAIAEMVGKTPPFQRKGGQPFRQRTHKVMQPDGTSLEVPICREDDLRPDQFEPYWRNARDDLMAAYDELCAFSCFRIHPITGAFSVDHMAAKSRAWRKVYEWDNYRLASTLMNSRKNDFEDVLDPFEVGDLWFVLELVGFQVMAGAQLTAEERQQVDDTIERLDLNNATLRTQRAADAEDYWNGDVSLRHLERESPFVAQELTRQGKLLPADA